MSLGKRLSGLTLVGLGAIGIAVCLAGIVGLWIGASRLQQVNSRLFRQVDQLIIQVDQRATQARDAVGGARDLVDALQRTLHESAAELVAGRVASLPQIDNIEQRLVSAVERTDELVTISASTAELIEQLLATIDAIASERSIGLHGSSELMATIQSTRESLVSASERLADVQRRLAEIRQKRGVDVNLSEITKLSLGLVAKLDVVQAQIAALGSHLDETKSRSARLQDRIRDWILAGECLILLLIAWISAGQFCLLLQGRRLLRRPASRASDRTR
jgi:chromosome segregation ATPase